VKVSAKGRYSLRALFDLAHHRETGPVPLSAVALRQDISLPFLEQIFNRLKKAGVVASARGPKGGYVLTRRCDQVSVGEVLRVTEGEIQPESSEDPKLDHGMSQLLFRKLSDRITDYVDGVTIADLCAESQSNTCTHCTCPEYVEEVQHRKAPAKSRK